MFFRSSILPYAWIKGELYFGFGLDSRYSELADFGGRCDFYDNQHLSTAIREYVEETSSPVDFDFETLIKLESKNHAVYIMHTMPYIMTNYIQYISNREISKGFLVKWNDMASMINGIPYKGYHMWASLADLIRPKLNSIYTDILKHKDEPIPHIPSTVHVSEKKIFHTSNMFPVAIGESNIRYELTDIGKCITRDEFLSSNYTRPHIRQHLIQEQAVSS